MFTRFINCFKCKSRRFSYEVDYDNETHTTTIPDFLPQNILDNLLDINETPDPCDLVILMPDLFDIPVANNLDNTYEDLESVGFEHSIYLGIDGI